VVIYYEDHPELAAGSPEQAMNDFNVIRVAVGADVERRVKPVLDRYEQQLAGQQRIVSRLRYLSPAILMQDALNDISGTGAARHRHFMAQVADYHQRWRAHFIPLIFKKAQVDSYSGLPAFVYREEPLRALASRAAAAIASMLVLAGLMAAWGLTRLRRYPVAS
jgi:ABC-2 type transport system permease protein